MSLNEVLKQRMNDGQSEYGRFIPETDKRNLRNEAMEEIADAINYLYMDIAKLAMNLGARSASFIVIESRAEKIRKLVQMYEEFDLEC